MYTPRELLGIDPDSSRDQKCQDILTNWEIVCEENEREKDFVTVEQWGMWVTKRESVNAKLVELSHEKLDAIYSYLETLDYSIRSASRVNMEEEYQRSKTKEVEESVAQVPSVGLMAKLLKWKKS